MGHTIRLLLISLALGYLGLCVALFLGQRRFIYFPPATAPGAGATITYPLAGARIVVSTRPLEGTEALLYLGGNAEDVSLNMPSFSTAFPHHALYLPHYRGYGGSSGTPSERALFADALALFDDVHARHTKVTVVGRSLGSAVAVYLAARRPVARLVLVTPFDSLQALAARQFRLLPVEWLLLDKFESWRYAPLVQAPTLLIAAEDDEIVPRSSTERLRSRFRGGLASFAVLSGTTHNNLESNPQYLRLLRQEP